MPPLRLLLALCAALASAPCAALAAEPARPALVNIPDAYAVWQVYPPTAELFDVEGVAGLDCVLDADGLLRNCQVGGETPEGQGFGDAALSLARHFKLTPKGPGGESFAGRAQHVDVRFRLTPRGVPVEPVDYRWWPAPEKLLPVKRRPQGLKAAVLSYRCAVGPEGLLKGCALDWAASAGPDYTAHAARWLERLKARPQAVGADGAVRLSFEVFTVDERTRNWLQLVEEFPAGDPRQMETLELTGLSLTIGPPPPRLGRAADGEGPLRWSDDAAAPALFYPPEALKRRRGARVIMKCRAADDGRLGRCRASGYEEDARPFVQASRSLAPYLRLAPGAGQASTGQAVEFELLFSPGLDGLTPDIRYLPGRPFASDVGPDDEEEDEEE